MDGGTLTVDQNGFLTGSKGIDGAAINAQKATIIIDGNAVIAGNMVADDNNGGVIWIDKSDLTIQGKALLAANQAGEKVFADTTPGDMAGVRNGGAIYVNAESNVTIAGESVLAGNVGQCRRRCRVRAGASEEQFQSEEERAHGEGQRRHHQQPLRERQIRYPSPGTSRH